MHKKKAEQFDEEIGSVPVDDVINGDDIIADETDTVLGGESLYLTFEDEIAQGKELKLKAKDFVTKVNDTYRE